MADIHIQLDIQFVIAVNINTFDDRIDEQLFCLCHEALNRLQSVQHIPKEMIKVSEIALSSGFLIYHTFPFRAHSLRSSVSLRPTVARITLPGTKSIDKDDAVG